MDANCEFVWLYWDIDIDWYKAIRRIFNSSYNTHTYLLPFVVGSPHIRINLVNKFNNSFDALMSSENKIIELLVYITLHWALIQKKHELVQL